jgi:DNA-binding beta-propeller fold protein YncE
METSSGHSPVIPPVGLCSDKNGNIFVVDEGSAQVVEYAHGGTTPIKTLDDYGNQPNGCYVDPTTGNLAVVGGGLNIEDSVAIYPNASGSPIVYKADAGGYFLYCTFDDKGNLFVSVGAVQNVAIWELPKGGNALRPFSLDKTLGPDGGLQWDGNYLDVQNAPGFGPMNEPGPIMIYQIKVDGSAGTVVHTILMDSSRNPKNDRQSALGSQFWIQGHMIYTRVRGDGPEGVWHYPSGGTRIRSFHVLGNLLGVTVSVSPGH